VGFRGSPRAGRIALGLALTLASTAAGMVPPYLTMPLVDKVLVPFQAGQNVDFGLVPWYLGGLLIAPFNRSPAEIEPNGRLPDADDPASDDRPL
jgi:hypothetical protein